MRPYEKVDSEDPLLATSDKSDDFHLRLPTQRGQRRWIIGPLIVALLVSASLNGWWLLFGGQRHVASRKLSVTEQMAALRSPYSGLAYDTLVPYGHHTDYTSQNKTLADEMWESLSIDPLVIAPTPEWIEEMGLPPSWDFPWDPKRKVYFVKVFHQLHCLKLMRKSFHQLWSGQETTIPTGHIEHCLDSLRQDMMCKADDTPMPSLQLFNGAGENQLMHCKDFSKLVAWIKAPERDACYNRIANEKLIVHSIERYAFCPDDSEHYPAMKKYFDTYGHYADPFAR